jgi:hypothetical protein
VFVAVTLSQAGRSCAGGAPASPIGAAASWSTASALLTAIVVLVAAVTKLTEGAWVVVVGIPVLVWLCLRVRGHYRAVDEALRLQPLPAAASPADGGGPPRDGDRLAAPAAQQQDRTERQESPEQIQHLLLVPVERLDLANLRALAYAGSFGQRCSPCTSAPRRTRPSASAMSGRPGASRCRRGLPFGNAIRITQPAPRPFAVPRAGGADLRIG